MADLPFHRRVIARFGRVPVPIYAAALAYYALLGLFPLLLLLVGIAGIALGKNPELSAAFVHQLEAWAGHLFPTAREASQAVLRALTRGAPAFTLGSALLLGWTASHFFTALSTVLSVVFSGRPQGLRHRFHGLLGPLIVGLALLLASVLGLVLGLLARFLPAGPWTAYLGVAASYLTSTLVIFAIYRFLVIPPPPTGPALAAGILVALSWNLVAWGLPRLLPERQSALVYGPLAGPVLLLFGFYLLMWLLVAGAVVLAAYAAPSEPPDRPEESP